MNQTFEFIKIILTVLFKLLMIVCLGKFLLLFVPLYFYLLSISFQGPMTFDFLLLIFVATVFLLTAVGIVILVTKDLLCLLLKHRS